MLKTAILKKYLKNAYELNFILKFILDLRINCNIKKLLKRILSSSGSHGIGHRMPKR